jgi:hypothetical protein
VDAKKVISESGKFLQRATNVVVVGFVVLAAHAAILESHFGAQDCAVVVGFVGLWAGARFALSYLFQLERSERENAVYLIGFLGATALFVVLNHTPEEAAVGQRSREERGLALDNATTINPDTPEWAFPEKKSSSGHLDLSKHSVRQSAPRLTAAVATRWLHLLRKHCSPRFGATLGIPLRFGVATVQSSLWTPGRRWQYSNARKARLGSGLQRDNEPENTVGSTPT